MEGLQDIHCQMLLSLQGCDFCWYQGPAPRVEGHSYSSSQASHMPAKLCALSRRKCCHACQLSTLGLALADAAASEVPGKVTLLSGAARDERQYNRSWQIKHANDHLPMH